MREQYDLIVVGGGIAGSSLGGRVAKSGARVLILEREQKFRDRVRGEWVAPWGVIELERLGLLGVLRDRAAAHDLPFQHNGINQLSPTPIDLVQRTTVHRPALTFFHPTVQEVLLGWAAEQGVEVIRGVPVTGVTAGESPSVEWGGIAPGAARARLVVGADGRASTVRQTFDRKEQTRGEQRLWAGVRLRNLDWPSDSGMLIFDPASGYVGALFPQGEGVARAYLGPSRAERERLSGTKGLAPFLAGLRSLLGGRDVFGSAEAIGPLATFDTDMRWVEDPYDDGLVLVGDGAGYTDPTFGQGLSLGFRDARVLSEALSGSDDWRAAAASYAAEHDRYFGVMVEAESWAEELLLTPGPDGDATRARALSAWSTDPNRDPNAALNGPDFEADEETRRRYFALDLVQHRR